MKGPGEARRCPERGPRVGAQRVQQEVIEDMGENVEKGLWVGVSSENIRSMESFVDMY